MALDAKNVWQGIVGLVADPEFATDSIVTFRVAVDGAGRDKDNPDNYSGYFNMKFFLNDDPNSKFVKNQIDAGNIKKGSTLGVVGKLLHERWSKDDQRNSSVSIVAESITYVGRRSDPEGTAATNGETTTAPAATATASIPSSF